MVLLYEYSLSYMIVNPVGQQNCAILVV